MPDTREGRAAQTTGETMTCAERGRREDTRATCAARCEPRTASPAREPAPKPPVLSMYWRWLSLFTVVVQIWPGA